MKYYSLLVCLGLFFSSCEEDAIESNCEYSEYISETYTTDARYLLFDEIYNDQTHPDYNQVEFDDEKVSDILDAFQAVYNLEVPERDTVMGELPIHISPFLSMQYLSLGLSVGTPELQGLINGEPTGNETLDFIVSEYDFALDGNPLYFTEVVYLSLRTSRELNLAAIKQVLSPLAFISSVNVDGAIGDGSTIELSRDGDSYIIDFSIGWGDCPAGCIYRRHWIFEVDENCEASFIMSYD